MPLSGRIIGPEEFLSTVAKAFALRAWRGRGRVYRCRERFRTSRYAAYERFARPADRAGGDDVRMSSALPESTLRTLGAVLRARRLAKGLSLRDLSSRTGVSNAYLSELERGRHEPSLSVLLAITSALDTPLSEILVQAGVLDDGNGADGSCRWSTEEAIARDPGLSEPQRFALLSVYRSFGLGGSRGFD
jgi:transcriptional regulator with XRE-family HTH domain